jgi:two-component system, OmpR family, sensor histidine kinase BaeS
MRRGLRLRLAFTHAAVAVLAIIAVALIVNVTGAHRFTSYLDQVQQARDQALVKTLADTYKRPDGWDAQAIYALSRAAMANGVNLAVYSPGGDLLFTAQGVMGAGVMNGRTGMMGQGGMMGQAGASPGAVAAGGYSLSSFTVRRYPVAVSGRGVGDVQIFAPRGRVAADSAYQSALSRTLIIAAIVAGGLALLISLLVSRRITGPLEELTDAAGDVAGGNLEVRVAPRGDDEVAALAQAFNSMADRLARDEQWRRDMTADLSHELRTPLATIQSRVEALEDGVLPATPENLRVIGEEVERLGRLLGALRSLNELESEDLDMRLQRVDLAEVARDAVTRAEPAFRAKDVALAAELTPVSVMADRDRMLQVAANLLDNALKFTPAGGAVTVSVAGAAAPDGAATGGGALEPAGGVADQGWGMLRVSDDGPGIAPGDLAFIFDRFYRSQAARGTQGVGLGLAIVSGLMEAQGGAVQAGNRPEGGAAFTTFLRRTT